MTAKFNKAEMFRRAHAVARSAARFDPTGYRFHFQRALKAAWAEAKRLDEGRKALAALMARQALRDQQNVGLPVRSCRADMAPRPVAYLRSPSCSPLYAGY
jgi:hypothetical protein